MIDTADLIARLNRGAEIWQFVFQYHPSYRDPELIGVLSETASALTAQAQEIERLKVDIAFIRAGHKPDDGLCDHKHWSFDKHGRCCTCGVFMVDFGD